MLWQPQVEQLASLARARRRVARRCKLAHRRFDGGAKESVELRRTRLYGTNKKRH